MSLRLTMMRQFASPRGPLGALAGWIMANRPSNRARNLWTIELLGLEPGQRVLEIGCGPGFALAVCAAKVGDGGVVGLDHSATMIAQARARLRRGVNSERVELRLGGLQLIDELGRRPFDRIFFVNLVQFLPDKASAFRRVLAALAPGGLVAVSYQPRGGAQTREEALRMAGEIRGVMDEVGFVDLRVEELPLRPAPAVCVLGRRSNEPASPS